MCCLVNTALFVASQNQQLPTLVVDHVSYNTHTRTQFTCQTVSYQFKLISNINS